jgi:hypothetical protein
MSNVRASHVAGDEYGFGVMRTDGGIEHRTTAARPKDAKASWPLSKSAGQAENESDADGYSEFHGFFGQR